MRVAVHVVICLTVGQDGHVAVNRLAPLLVGVGPAGEPIIAVARLSRLAIWAVIAGLSSDVIATQQSLLKAIFSLLLFIIGGKVVGVEEFVDEFLILADAVAEHSTMVTVMINTPLNVNDITSLVGGHDISPIG